MINSIQLLGRVGKPVDFKTLNGGTKVAEIYLATSETFKNKQGEKVEDTQWHSVTLWGNLAELAQKYVNKGDLIYISGSIKYDHWEKDGYKHEKARITASQMKFISSPKKQESQESKTEAVEDQLPF